MKLPERETYRYHSRYCEENIWYLCQEPEFRHSEVMVIAATGDCFPIRCQRAAEAPDQPLLWDYHVVLLWQAEGVRYLLDFDTTLAFCTPVEAYFRLSFLDEALLNPEFIPRFRIMSAEEYVVQLVSDRRHMRTAGGGWQAPPPAWPPISTSGSNLHKFWDMSDLEFGRVLGMGELLAESGAEARFRLRAARGNVAEGLAVLDKLDQHDSKVGK